MLDLIANEDRNWLREDAPQSLSSAPSSIFRAEEIALSHLELADGLRRQAGHESVALAHRLAAAVLFSLTSTEQHNWWLAVLVRDIITVGEDALPDHLEALGCLLEPVGTASLPFRALVDDLTEDAVAAEHHYAELIRLACSIAREVAPIP
jgi:hypothetical protein